MTDAGVAELIALDGLKLLNLAGAKITDESLKHLLVLPRLEHVAVANTKVTEAGMKALQAARPELRIIR